MAALIARVDGEWRFDTADSGTRVTWQWSIHPRNAAARLAMPVFVRLWRGFARQSLPELGRQLS
ncbi:hypothetical protein LV457_02195 [Mycobacterium sp. MYCO198283]|uniref:SRPBCC family protein n=1 Tax=Mycobacterium sp. MYCO198283 TaxID=2883505 RepID=UPI001E48FF48|nr:SRPBCC family protein [Mycobacterium sp. MYCO198283]MCG5431103.1 hypothetical protein [Mycobacterium sp. MYCO198283]